MSDNALFEIEVTERRCGRCKEVRPIAMFYVEYEKRRAITRGSRQLGCCRLCVRKNNQDRLAERRDVVDKIKTDSGCVDCGYRNDEHPEVFDLDHLPGFTKVRPVSAMLHGAPMEAILAEVAKCEVVCANCHRIRTRARESNAFGVDRGPKKMSRD